MHTAVHEMQHQVQNEAIRTYDSLSWQEIQDIRAGTADHDPFAQYNLTVDEAEAMSRQHYEGDDEAYLARPKEVDARRAGRSDSGASMSPEDFRAVAERAGVEIED